MSDTAVEQVSPTGVVRIDSWKVICDECRDTFENHVGWTIFGDESDAMDNARDADWLIREGIALCPSCWEKPDNEAAVREAVAGSPYPGLYEVMVNPYTPADKVFVVPHWTTLPSPIRSVNPPTA